MNERKILRLFPNASRSFVAANARLHPAEPSEPDQQALDGSPAREKESLGRVVVRFTCFRCQLLDPDNHAASIKDLLDGLRHAHCIRDDSAKFVKVETDQVKVNRRSDEKTEIEIIWP